jgi:hypothetical protein
MEEHKVNFSEEEAQAKKQLNVDESKKAVKEDAEGLFKSIKVFFKELLDSSLSNLSYKLPHVPKSFQSNSAEIT